MDQSDIANRLLNRLAPEARAALSRTGQIVTLEIGTVLAEPGIATDHVHFIEKGFVSLVCEDHAAPVEVGMVGREGLAGGWLALGLDASPFRVVVQAPVRALKLTRTAFRQACRDEPALFSLVLGSAQHLMGMLAETCWANTRLSVEGRVARWLVMARDRVDGDDLSITHETLSRMLGVRRPGVTVALHVLEGEHMIKATRGTIRVLDRDKLLAVSRGHKVSDVAALPAFRSEPSLAAALPAHA